MRSQISIGNSCSLFVRLRLGGIMKNLVFKTQFLNNLEIDQISKFCQSWHFSNPTPISIFVLIGTIERWWKTAKFRKL